MHYCLKSNLWCPLSWYHHFMSPNIKYLILQRSDLKSWHYLLNMKWIALGHIELEIWLWISHLSLYLEIHLWDRRRCRWSPLPTSVISSGCVVEAWLQSTTLCLTWLLGNIAHGPPQEEECLLKETHHWQLVKKIKVFKCRAKKAVGATCRTQG